MTYGEKNGRARLTQKRVFIIRSYFEINKRPLGASAHSSWVTQGEIARRLGMATSSIRSLLMGKTWKM